MSLNLLKIQRGKVQQLLSDIPGIKKAYYEPPSDIMLDYPCIIYQFDRYEGVMYSANDVYAAWPSFTITIIDFDPESNIPFEFVELKKKNCNISLDRTFSADGLYHWIFKLIFLDGSIS